MPDRRQRCSCGADVKHDYEACLNDITRIVKDIVWGDAEQVRTLFRYTNDPSVPASVGRLAEQIGTLIVQKEVREFQLENLIEDLFSTRTALAQARHDPLTGLPNRAMFEEMLHKACGSALECGSGLALLLVDFDRFKEVNDSLGHAAGDELLVQGAARLRGCVGDRGLVGRMGGDEFAVLLIDQAEKDVLRTAECILEAIRARSRCKRERPASARPWGSRFIRWRPLPPLACSRTPMSPCIALRVKGGIGCGAIAVNVHR